ncbi:MAG: DEAD/DEAH box helicase [Leptospiraceae bacterium]|nr:DEAD/DEAH box helicase [Leptospiraceae bacterium]
MKFSELNLHESLQSAIDELGFIETTLIQEKAIPVALSGKDITGLAQTGTGKTISFLVPIFNKIFTENLSVSHYALILAPTRELALQICEEGKKLIGKSDVKIATLIGGTGYKEQEKEISESAELIVATPGRLIDHIKSGKLDLSKILFFVLDEADRMFDMGFIKDVRYVMKRCPKEVQVMLFSATLSYYVMRLASEYLKDPVEIRIEPEKIVTENIDQKLVHLAREEKLSYLVNLILNDKEEGLGIIFTNLKVILPEIVNTLRNYGIAVTGISSELVQKKRVRLLKDFKLGKYHYMVATDVASRGIDIDNIKVVYNYDLPMDTENYVHRIGRTARAGRKGRSISFCSERDYTELEKIETFLGKKIPVDEVNEEYLIFPKGEFDRFTMPNEKDDFEVKSKKDKKKKFDPRDKNSRRDFKDKKNFKDKKQFVYKNPLDEAELLIQKADSVLKVEKPNQKNDGFKNKKQNPNPNKKEKFNRPQKKFESVEMETKEYDKSKRNLFDINDTKKPVVKKSLWQRIKNLFSF